jgi:hypothetical protein
VQVQEARRVGRKGAAMGTITAPARSLSQGEQRALRSFLAGRLPAGQLHDELCRAREEAIAKATAHSQPQPVPTPALSAA